MKPTFRYPPVSMQLIRGVRLALLSAVTFSVSGCLLSSPYWNQAFDSHTDKVPMQTWTTDSTLIVKFECAPAGHGGLYPFGGTPTWYNVGSVDVADTPLYDSSGTAVYTAGLHKKLPASCWREDPANGVWYAAVRASHTTGGNTSFYHTLDKTGLECAGRENGKAGTWFGWYVQACYEAYTSGDHVPYVIIRASS